MVTYVIELSDADIKVATAGEIVLHSPGYALVKDTQIEVGEAAYNQARLHPQRAHNQFWHRLSLDPLTHPTPYYRHHADLVHAHLKHIAEQLEDSAEAVFAVPGSYSKEQLSLLLGVVQESPLTAVGLVDMAAAVASVYPLHQTAFYLDIFLHEAVVSRLDVGDQINRSKVIPVKGVGLAKLYDRWVQLVADVFIEQCRFDPLHSAVTEQALYRKLPLWLAAIEQEQEVLLEIESGANRFQARLLPTQVVERANVYYQQLTAALAEFNVNGSLLISERLAQLPGIKTLFPTAQVVSAQAFCQGCEQNMTSIRRVGEPLSFVTALPSHHISVANATQPAVAVIKNQKDAAATHILAGHMAYSLSQELWVGYSTDQQIVVASDRAQLATVICSLIWQGKNLFLNRLVTDVPLKVNESAVAQRSELRAGDELLVGDQAYRLSLIRVV